VEIMGDLSSGDAERLKALIERHKNFTNSDVAAKILENWASYLPKFKKVMPFEYRRALQGMRRSLLPHGLPGQQPDPGLERPRLSWRLAAGCREPAFDEQLPRDHRTRLSGAVRSRLHAEHHRQARHDQVDRIRDRRARMGGRLDKTAAARKEDRQESRDHRIGPRWPRGCAATGARRPRRTRL
jgi:hypothetical protein